MSDDMYEVPGSVLRDLRELREHHSNLGVFTAALEADITEAMRHLRRIHGWAVKTLERADREDIDAHACISMLTATLEDIIGETREALK